ncbi:MAG: uroporphyrinogen decarboxylase family protein, partial [Bacteroidales bacterium]
DGSILIYPEGDKSVAPSAKMPAAGFFFDALNRQGQIVEEELDPKDNLEEFKLLTEDDLKHWEMEAERLRSKNKGVIASFGGTALGDIALVPAMHLKNPKGLRDVAEWYMSLLMRRDYIHKVFEKQTEIALQNLESLHKVTDDVVDAVFICGTDFGTQDSQFCSLEDFNELYAPYYKRINDWIHKNTRWKTFKHSCGSVEPFMKAFIDSGFDIINPVQINAAGMDPVHLKKEYGDHIVFWGGGADTQITLPFGKPEEVKEQVKHNCEIFSENGGFVFNVVHNIQANVPIENVIAMMEILEETNS